MREGQIAVLQNSTGILNTGQLRGVKSDLHVMAKKLND